MKSRPLAIATALLLGLILSNTASAAEDASDLLEKGIYAEQTAGDLDAAIGLYQQVLSLHEADQELPARAMLRMGVCYRKQGSRTKAIEILRKLIDQFPNQKALVASAKREIAATKTVMTPDEVGQVVSAAVTTISTCAEGDRRIGKALASLEELDAKLVVDKTAEFLDSKKDTVRRSAIYVLWRGNFDSIDSAVPRLEKLCHHTEDLTRGMATLALAGSKAKTSFDAICDMALNDTSPYARRCAAYALGLTKNKAAIPVLEKVLKDKASLVRNNAQAALTMLREASGGDDAAGQQFPEFRGCRVVETVEMDFSPDSEEADNWTVHEQACLRIRWRLLPRVADLADSFRLALAPAGKNVLDPGQQLWASSELPGTARSVFYGQSSSETPDGPVANTVKPLPAGRYRLALAVLGTKVKADGTKEMIASLTRDLTVKPMQMTQMMINEIQADGTIAFRSIIQRTNKSGNTLHTTGFINSDFVHLTRMTDDLGRPIRFTTKHDGNIFRYQVTLNDPVPPGELLLYSSEGTIAGLVKQEGPENEFVYRMRHSPATGRPTRRLETFRLPWGAEILKTTPGDLPRRIDQGRIQVLVDKIVPAGGNIYTEIHYRLDTNSAAIETAATDAGAWLEVVDGADYALSWQEAAAFFREAISEAQWEASLKTVRTPLGKVLSRKVLSAEYATSLPGAPDGEYVVIQFETSFENKKDAVETVTPMKDADGKWRVSGYYIK